MSIGRSENMRRIRSKDTAPELVVRRLVRVLGFGYRLNRKDIPGTPDLAFYGRRKVVFVHGCFWHQHPGCREGRAPKSNVAYWLSKLELNRVRDETAMERLIEADWSVLIVWECETRNPEKLAKRLGRFLSHVKTTDRVPKPVMLPPIP